jgi:phosphoglycerate dehydrogenase-like enzyme
MTTRFRITWTADFFGPDGTPLYRDLGRSVLDGHRHIECSSFAERHPEITPEQVGDAQGVVVLTPAVTRASVSVADNLLAFARFGVGFDAVDVRACTDADVAVVIAAGAVDRSVAEATLAWMLALTHHVRIKDRLVRDGRWQERSRWMGSELRDRTLGVVGLGGIARALLHLAAGFGMKKPLAHDPFIDPQKAESLGVRWVALDELLRESDFVSIHCPLTPQTRDLIGSRELALMKPSAYLINTARGGIVDETALHEALAGGRIAGAAVDVFATEPLRGPPRLAELDNVLLAPHCIAWTDEMFRDIGRTVCQALLDLSLGRRPTGVVNPEVFDRPTFQAKWQRLRAD